MKINLAGKKIKGIIFDMDGTMIDNMMIHHRAWQRKLKEYGVDLPLAEVKARIHGVNEEILKREFGDRFSPAERKQIAWEKEAAYREIYRPELQLIKGLPAFLSNLDKFNFPYGIGTAAPSENAFFVLDQLKMRDQFQSIIHAGDVTNGKPDPEVFEKAAHGMGLALKDCLIFEDSPTGAEAAHRGGAIAIIITTTHSADEFAHLPNIAKTINDFTMLNLAQKDGALYLN